MILPKKVRLDKDEVLRIIQANIEVGNKETARKLSMLWVCL